MLFTLASILSSLLRIYLLILVVRIVFDWVQMFARAWRPTGPLLVVANLVYSLTDPPLRWLRRVVPMVRFGGVGIDLSFLVLFFAIALLQTVLAYIG